MRRVKFDDGMPTFKIHLAGNPHLCIIKGNKEKFHAVVDFGAEV